jgi:hypothetical protein
MARKELVKVPTLVVQDVLKGHIMLMTRTEYLKIIKDPEVEIRDFPKLLGVLHPSNRALIQWEEQPTVKPSQRIEWKLNTFQYNFLNNLVNDNVDYLANKSRKNFLLNFNAVVMNKIKKPLRVKK